MKTYKGNSNDEGKTKARNKDKYEDKDKNSLQKMITKIGQVLCVKLKAVKSSMKSWQSSTFWVRYLGATITEKP